MAVNIKANNVDLDDLFALRSSTKRANVQFQYNGVDLSDRYEPSQNSQDRIDTNTGYQSNGTDLRDLFRAKNYTRLVVRVITNRETYETYGRNNDGSIVVYVDTTYAKLNGTGTQYNFSINIGGTAYTKAIASSNPLGYTEVARRTSLNAQNYNVTVTDNNSGKSLSFIVNVPYNTPTSRTYNQATT